MGGVGGVLEYREDPEFGLSSTPWKILEEGNIDGRFPISQTNPCIDCLEMSRNLLHLLLKKACGSRAAPGAPSAPGEGLSRGGRQPEADGTRGASHCEARRRASDFYHVALVLMDFIFIFFASKGEGPCFSIGFLELVGL